MTDHKMIAHFLDKTMRGWMDYSSCFRTSNGRISWKHGRPSHNSSRGCSVTSYGRKSCCSLSGRSEPACRKAGPPSSCVRSIAKS